MVTLIILLAMALIFGFLNGIHDSSNIVATIIFSRALPPRVALWLTAAAEFAGPFIFGVAVAKTIGEGIVDPSHITVSIIMAALGSAVIWNLLTWFFGIPSSSSHAVIGGIVGSITVSVGFQEIHPEGLIKILIALFASPVIGLTFGFLFTKLVFFLARNATLKVNWFFKNAQVLTGIGLALSHGANDAQKTMGIMALALVASGYLETFEVPLWVIALSASAISLGTAFGGWRLIRTLGGKFFRIRPVDGFAIQVSSAVVILSAALLGGPVSTTQVVSSSILGVGSAERLNKVRWGVAQEIGFAWLLTIPANAIVAGLLCLLLRNFIH